MQVHRLLPFVLAVGCGPRTQTTPPEAGGAEASTQQSSTSTDDDGARSTSSGHGNGSASADPPKHATTPVPPEFSPTRGFEAFPAELVWSCDSYAVALPNATPPIIRDAESLAAVVEGERRSGCSGPPPSVDFDEFGLTWAYLSFTSRISYVAMREDAVEIGVTTQAYCGGPQPPGPQVVFIAVPKSTTAVTTIERNVGKCEGPPQP